MLLERLKDKTNLTRTDQKIASYVLVNANQVVHMAIKDFSASVAVSKASVVRFCQHLGIKGFREFKLTLSQELAANDNSKFNIVQRQNVGDLSLSEVFYNALSLDGQAVTQLTSTLDLKKVQAAIDMLSASHTAAAFGAGASAIVADDLVHKLTKLRMNVRTSRDFHYSLSIVLAMKPGSPLFLISTSGETQEVLELAKFAHEQQIKVIAITTLQQSSLAREADIVLATPVLEDVFRVGNMATRISQLAVVDVLYMGLYETIGDEAIQEFYDLRDAVMRFRR